MASLGIQQIGDWADDEEDLPEPPPAPVFSMLLGNLPDTVEAQDVEDLFEVKIAGIAVHKQEAGNRTWQLDFKSEADMNSAIRATDGQTMLGQSIWAKPARSMAAQPASRAHSGYEHDSRPGSFADRAPSGGYGGRDNYHDRGPPGRPGADRGAPPRDYNGFGGGARGGFPDSGGYGARPGSFDRGPRPDSFRSNDDFRRGGGPPRGSFGPGGDFGGRPVDPAYNAFSSTQRLPSGGSAFIDRPRPGLGPAVSRDLDLPARGPAPAAGDGGRGRGAAQHAGGAAEGQDKVGGTDNGGGAGAPSVGHKHAGGGAGAHGSGPKGARHGGAPSGASTPAAAGAAVGQGAGAAAAKGGDGKGGDGKGAAGAGAGPGAEKAGEKAGGKAGKAAAAAGAASSKAPQPPVEAKGRELYEKLKATAPKPTATSNVFELLQLADDQ